MSLIRKIMFAVGVKPRKAQSTMAENIIDYTTGPGGLVDITSEEFLSKVEFVATKAEADGWTIEPYKNTHWSSVDPDTGNPQGPMITRTLANVRFTKIGYGAKSIDAYNLNGGQPDTDAVTDRGPVNAVHTLRSEWGLPPMTGVAVWEPPSPASPVGGRHPRSSKWFKHTGAKKPDGSEYEQLDIVVEKLEGRDQRFQMVKIGQGGFFASGRGTQQYELVWETIT